MRLGRAWLESRIPHRGRMCLLDEVTDWNPERISCRTATHRAADNPLRAHGRLGIACGIEYAAQAMAAHGALMAGSAVPGATSPAMEPTAVGPTTASPAMRAPAAASLGTNSAGIEPTAVGPPATASLGATSPAMEPTAVGPTAASPAIPSPGVASPAAGFLAGVRAVRMYVSRLDDVPGELICEALRIAGDAGTAVYEFELRSATAALLRGRATVLFGAGRRI